MSNENNRSSYHPVGDGWLRALGAVGAVGTIVAVTAHTLGSSLGRMKDENETVAAMPKFLRNQILSNANENPEEATKPNNSQFSIQELEELSEKFKGEGESSFKERNYSRVRWVCGIQDTLDAMIQARQEMMEAQKMGDMSKLQSLLVNVQKLQNKLEATLDAEEVEPSVQVQEVEPSTQVQDVSESLYSVMKRKICREQQQTTHESNRKSKRLKPTSSPPNEVSPTKANDNTSTDSLKKKHADKVLETPNLVAGDKFVPGQFVTDVDERCFYVAMDGETIKNVSQKVAKEFDMEDVDDVLDDLVSQNSERYLKASLQDPNGELVEGTVLVVPPHSWPRESDVDDEGTHHIIGD